MEMNCLSCTGGRGRRSCENGGGDLLHVLTYLGISTSNSQTPIGAIVYICTDFGAWI